MSEYLNDSKERRTQLMKLAIGILQGKRQPSFVKEYEDAIAAVVPRDVIFIVDGLLQSGAEIEVVKKAVSQVINLMYTALQDEGARSWENCGFLNAMKDENREMESRMHSIKQLVKTINVKDIDREQFQHLKIEIREKLQELTEFDAHYVRKENILFPYLEKQWSDFRCLQLMWSLHDDVRVGLKVLGELLEDEEMSLKEFNYAIGTLYFSVYPLIYREENILFPVAFDELPEYAWEEMMAQSHEFGYAFIDSPVFKEKDRPSANKKPGSNHMLDLGTGLVSMDQLVQIFNHLPVDITFVDDKDEVRYFNESKKRHFPRSKAIIGRKVQNCHPPESIEIVNQIVDSFKEGTKDKESFWIQMKEKFIHIEYFAVRNENGQYKGSLEVSQDVTNIRELTGEKRLIV